MSCLVCCNGSALNVLWLMVKQNEMMVGIFSVAVLISELHKIPKRFVQLRMQVHCLLNIFL